MAQECEPDMPLSYIRILLELMLAHLEGGESRISLTQKDLLERTGAEQSSLSRALSVLSNSRRSVNAEPYNLAESFPDPRDRRFRIVRLNDRGIGLLNKIVTSLDEVKH
jgi:DNA-binding MarR family transcriptional regulator